jgi:hypothetical protein
MSIKEGVQISQRELQEIYELQRELVEKQNHLEELKSGVKTLLIGKAPIEFGRFAAYLITIPGRNVPWKQVVIQELGAEFADACRKRYKVHVRFDVRVEEHAVEPLWKTGANSDPGERIN